MSFTKSLVVLCTVLLAEVAHAQLRLPATVQSCDAVKVQANFNTAAYLGDWYEYAYAAGGDPASGKCYTTNYSKAGRNSIAVTTALHDPAFNPGDIVGGTVTSSNGDAKVEVYFPLWLKSSSYWVLGTDYVNYSVVWSCVEYYTGELKAVTAWILTRSPEPTAEVIEAAYAVLDANNIPRDYVRVTDQKNC